MKKEENKKNEESLQPVKTDDPSTGREHIEPLDKKETMEERARREHWTDTAESHLGIDE